MTHLLISLATSNPIVAVRSPCCGAVFGLAIAFRVAEGTSKPLSVEAKQAQAEVKAVAKWLRERGAAKAKVSEVRGKGGLRDPR